MVGYAVAQDNLRLGRTVVADCVNPWPLTREAWRAVAQRAQGQSLDVEITCSDAGEHRRRVESRLADAANVSVDEAVRRIRQASGHA